MPFWRKYLERKCGKIPCIWLFPTLIQYPKLIFQSILYNFIFFPSCKQQGSMLWWQPTFTWRGKLVTLWSRHICPASWQSSSPKCHSGSTESPSLPELSLVSHLLSFPVNICGYRNEPITRRFQLCSWEIIVKDTLMAHLAFSPKRWQLKTQQQKLRIVEISRNVCKNWFAGYFLTTMSQLEFTKHLNYLYRCN